ncbi:hypothetical protein EDD85DRAFT_872005 [Armillaria nabsnona]|nr:hypothetical protein EDD85DRAFT_872005 [Armillaria nabsnona]
MQSFLSCQACGTIHLLAATASCYVYLLPKGLPSMRQTRCRTTSSLYPLGARCSLSSPWEEGECMHRSFIGCTR